MSDDKKRAQTPITNIAPTDQATAELRDTVGRVVAYHAMLIKAGIPSDAAAEMTSEYNSLRLARYFNVPVTGMWG